MVKIGAVIGVKDENELIEANVRHLREIGVDSIHILDMGSEDGAREIILNRLVPMGISCSMIAVNNLEAAERIYRNYFTAGLKMISALDDLDWVLMLDADEFWVPKSGNLKDLALSDDADFLVVPRFNACLTSDLIDGTGDPLHSIASLPLHVAPIKLSAGVMKDRPDLIWSKGVPMPKILVRPDRVADIALGAHSAAGKNGDKLRKQPVDDVVVVHLPFTTLSRFERKVGNMRKVAQALLAAGVEWPENFGWHWKRWFEMSEGEVVEEYKNQAMTPDEIRHLRENREVMSAEAYLRRDQS